MALNMKMFTLGMKTGDSDWVLNFCWGQRAQAVSDCLSAVKSAFMKPQIQAQVHPHTPG